MVRPCHYSYSYNERDVVLINSIKKNHLKNHDDDNDRSKRNTVWDEMTIEHCNFSERNDLLISVLDKLAKLQRNDHDTGHGDAGDEVDRYWRRITFDSCEGYFDIIIMTIFSCHVKSLDIIIDENEDNNLSYWSSLIKRIRTTKNTSLTELSLSNISIYYNKRLGESLLSSNYSNNNKLEIKNKNPFTNIIKLDLNGCNFNFDDNDDDNDQSTSRIVSTAKFMCRLFPLLLSLKLNFNNLLSDNDMAKFLSCTLLANENVSTLDTNTDTIDGMKTERSDDDFYFTQLKELILLLPDQDSITKTLSVVSKWLQLLQKKNSNLGHRSNRHDDKNVHDFPLSLKIYSKDQTEFRLLGDEFLNTFATANKSESELLLEYFEIGYFNFSSDELIKLTDGLLNIFHHLKSFKLLYCKLIDHVSIMENFFNSLAIKVTRIQLPSSSPRDSYCYSSLVELSFPGCRLNDNCLMTISKLLHNEHVPFLKLLHLNANPFSLSCVKTHFVPALCNHVNIENLLINFLPLEQPIEMTRIEIQILCDVNKGGRRYLKKKQHPMTTTTTTTSLWPLIFQRINTIRLIKFVRSLNATVNRTYNCGKTRRCSILYNFLINGAMIDILLHNHNETSSAAANSNSILSTKDNDEREQREEKRNKERRQTEASNGNKRYKYS